MKNRMFSYFNTKLLSLILGMVTALLVLGSTTLQYEVNQELSEETSTVNEDGAERPASTTQISNFTAVAQIVHVHLESPLLLHLGEINEAENQTTQPIWLTSDHYSQLFKTLFRRIISPNAP
jgi:hypothetical protein